MTTPPRSAPRRRARRTLAALAGAAAALTSLGSPAHAAPSSFPGDPHSPAVAMLATDALMARDRYVMSGAPEDFHRYQAKLGAAAFAVAAEFATDPGVVTGAFDAADLDHQTAALAALAQLGAPYRYASSDPGVGFDCSGLTSYAWRRVGVTLAPQSSAQIAQSPSVDPAAASAGDLVQYPGHVMMYLGFDDAIVHAANSANDVELSRTGGRSLNWADPTG